MKYKYIAVLLLLLLPLSVFSEPYAGLGISRVDSSTSSGLDTGDANGILIYAGNKFDQIGYEVSYSDIGEIDVPQSTTIFTGNILKIQASYFTDFSDNFQLFAKLGIAIPDIESNSGWSYNDTEPAWTIGFNHQFHETYNFRIEYEEFDDLNGLNINLLSFSINATFE